MCLLCHCPTLATQRHRKRVLEARLRAKAHPPRPRRGHLRTRSNDLPKENSTTTMPHQSQPPSSRRHVQPNQRLKSRSSLVMYTKHKQLSLRHSNTNDSDNNICPERGHSAKRASNNAISCVSLRPTKAISGGSSPDEERESDGPPHA